LVAEGYRFRAVLRACDFAVALRLRVVAAFFAERDRAAAGRLAESLAAARSADPAAALGGYVGVGNAAAGAAFVAAAGFLVDGGPGAPLGFLPADAAAFVALLDVFGLAFLLVGIAGFVAARHDRLPWRCGCESATRAGRARVPQTECETPRVTLIASLRDGLSR
jgi:hypothetical protein